MKNSAYRKQKRHFPAALSYLKVPYKLGLGILTATLCLVLQFSAQAQRRLPSQKEIQITGGTVNGISLDSKRGGIGYHFGAGVTTITTRRNYWKFGVEYLQKQHLYKDLTLPQTQITAEGGYYITFLSDGSKTLFLSAGLSVVAGYEAVNRSKRVLPDGATILNKDALLYGTALMLEAEVYLADWAALLLNVKERILFGSSIGKLNTQFGIGVKFTIY